MANTPIQIKRSLTSNTPATLNIGEPAYSYSSNTLFIGSPSEDGAIPIGGWDDYIRGISAYEKLNTAYHHANAGFIRANSALDANVGGTITGDVTIQGNLSIIGGSIGANVPVVLIGDNIISLNTAISQTGQPTMNAGIEIDRGAQPNTYLIWNETLDKWQFTNDGFTYDDLGGSSASSYANSAFVRANNSLDANNGGLVTAPVYFITPNFGIGEFQYAGGIDFWANNGTSYAQINYANTNYVYVDGSTAAIQTPNSQVVAFTSGDAQIQTGNGIISKYWNYYANGEFAWPDGTLQNTSPFATATYANSAYRLANSNFAHANSGFDHANSAFIKANSAYESQNATGQYANAAFTLANGAFIHANSGFIKANAAYQSQNATGNTANAAFANANGAFAKANASFAYANGAFAAGNLAFNQANSAFIKTNSAFGHANAGFIRANNSLDANNGGTVTGNVTVIGNVGAQNIYIAGTNGTISGANTIFANYVYAANGNVDLLIYSSRAFDNANAGLAMANAAFSNANGAFAAANAAFANANGAFAAANAAYIQANSGFIQANSAFLHANYAFANANAGLAMANASYAYANGAYTAANLAFNQANSGFIQANSAFLHANYAFSNANAGLAMANAAFANANGAFAAANAAYIQANSGFIQANSAFDHANAAYISQNATGQYANSAFIRANNSLNANLGGTVTANVFVDGNLTTQNVFVKSYIDLNTAPSNPTRVEGRVFYDKDQHALGYYNESDMTFQIGQESVVRVWNNTGSTITDGKAVFISGSSSANGFPGIALARADDADASEVIGLTTTTILNGGYGYVTTHGKVNGLNTSLLTEGQELFLSDTPGEYQTTAPASPSTPMVIGYVARSDVSDGSILVRLHVMEGKNKSNGAILFGRNGQIDQDPTTLYWDYANNSLGVGTDNPQANLHVTGSGLFTGNVIISGNLTVTNANFISTTELTVTGNTIVMNQGATGTPTLNAEIIVNRGSSTNAYIRWDESIDEWTLSEGDGATHILTSGKTAVTWDDYNSFADYEKQSYPIGSNLSKGIDYQANAAFDTANTGLNSALAAFKHANSGFIQANSAYAQANAAYQSQNATGQYANSAFIQANSAYQSQNATGQYANAAFNHANASFAAANNVFPQIQPAYNTANAAFIRANNSLNANVGGQVTGDVTIVGNVTSNTLTTTGSNGSISGANAIFTNYIFAANGTVDLFIYSSLAYANANAALAKANAAYAYANGGYTAANNAYANANGAFAAANAAYIQANSAFTYQNATANYANSGFIQANAAFNHANAAYNAANNVFPQIQPSYDTANAAFLQANVAIAHAQSAFNAQNTTGSYANSAFIQANAAYSDLNTVAIYANTPSYTANSADIYANGAFVQANLALGNALAASNYGNAAFIIANSGFIQANSAFYHANDAFNKSNSGYDAANSGGIYANGSFATANSGSQYANSAFIAANSGFIQANAAFDHANAAFNSANNVFPQVQPAYTTANYAFEAANSAGVYANAAFLAANNALDTWVRGQANAAFISANAAWNHANAAYNKANTGGGSGANAEFQILQTTADGINSTYALGFTPSTANGIAVVSVGGIVQIQNTDYYITTSNGTISFYEPPPGGEIIRVAGYQTVTPYYYDAANSAGAIVNSYNGVGDGSTQTFSLGFQPATSISVFVTVGGIVQPESAYTTSNVANTITFGTAPGVGENIRVVGFTKINPYYIQYTASNVSVSVYESTANGNTSSFNLGFNPQAKEYLTVTIDGIVQPLTAYSVNPSANTITFDAAPANGELIRVVTFYSTINPYYYNPANVTVSTFETTANGLVNSFALNYNPSSNQAVMVSIDGVVQPPSSYSVSNTSNTITFLSTPANGEYITVTSYGAVNVYMINDNTVTFDKLHTSVRQTINLTSYTIQTANDASNLAIFAASTANNASNTANAAATTGKAIAMSIVFGG